MIISFTFDTSFLERAKTRLNKLSETIHHWATENKATFAPKKSKIVCFRFPRKPSLDMSISSHIGPIEGVSEIDFLGVTFDETLSFKTQVNKTVASTTKLLFALKPAVRNRIKISHSTYYQIFISAILPKMFYAAPIWLSEGLKLLGPISKILRLSAALCTNCTKDTPNDFLFVMANIPHPDLLLKQQAVYRFLNIAFQTDYQVAQHILNCDCDTLWTLISTAESLGIPRSTIFNLSSPTKFGPSTLHPADRDKLTTHTTFDHFKQVKSNDIVFFTDGSSSKEGVESGLIVFPGNNLQTPSYSKSFRLPFFATVFNAESEVIPEGLLTALELHTKMNFPTAHLYLDNQATIKALANPIRSRNKTIHFIYNLVQTLPFQVTFSHIPGHKGHLGNELADTAARAGPKATNHLYPAITKAFLKQEVMHRIDEFHRTR